MQRSILIILCFLLGSCDSNKKELRNIKNELAKIKSEIRSIKRDIANETKIEKEFSELAKSLPDKKEYVLYNSDHEQTKQNDRQLNFKYETVYALPLEIYNTKTQSLADNYKINSTGIRMSEIGYNRGPIWNKSGNKIAYVNCSNSDQNSTMEGHIKIKDLNNGDIQSLNDFEVSATCGLSWDRSGNVLAFGQKKSIISTYDIKTKKVTSFGKSDISPEGISISPNGKHIVFMTRDGADSNDDDGWRLNLLNIERKEIVKIGEIDDKIVSYSNYLWHDDSQKVIFHGCRLNENGGRMNTFKFWEYNLNTKSLNSYKGNLEGFQDQQIRFWNSSKLERNRNRID